MDFHRPIAAALSAALVVSTAPAAQATHTHRPHPPIHVATPTDGSPITPYFFPYGWRYRYNSPGPVYGRLDYWGPLDSCRLWRYNYLYWVC
jgi:hypothetical protein